MSSGQGGKALAAAVELLASGAEQQIAYLEQLDVAPQADEIALEFDDLIAPLRDPMLETEQGKAMLPLDEHLAQMSGTGAAELWTTDALRTSPEWAQVRSLAHDALRARKEVDR